MHISHLASCLYCHRYDYSNAAGLVLSSSLDLPGMMDFSQQIATMQQQQQQQQQQQRGPAGSQAMMMPPQAMYAPGMSES